MVRVILNATDRYNPYSKAEIKKEDYKLSNFFFRYSHDPLEQLIAEDIKVFKDPKTIWQWYGYYITLKVRDDYKKHSLSLAHVYYNQFDTKRVPLVLVLFFHGNDEVQNRYYSLHNIDSEVINYVNKFIDDLSIYDEDNLFYELIFENDRFGHLLTYNLNLAFVSDQYNNGKIYISSELVMHPSGDSSHVFIRHQHLPTEKNKDKPGCLMYDFQSPMGRTNGIPIVLTEIQNKKYTSILVYWSSRVDVPLMFELDYRSYKDQILENEFYISKKDKNGIFFEKISFTSSEVKEVVISKHGSLYDVLTEDDNQILKRLLLRLERNLFKTLYILFSRMDTSYSGTDVVDALAISKFDYSKERIINKDGNVKPTDKTGQRENVCLKKTKFKAIEHDFSECIMALKDDEFVKIKFLFSNTRFLYKDGYVLLDMAQTNIVSPYNGGKYLIILSSNTYGDYKRFSHVGNNTQEITKGPFIVTFNGISVNFNGDLSSDKSYNQRLDVYFNKHHNDMFLVITFFLKGSNKMKYLTYSEYLDASITNTTIFFSKLNEVDVNDYNTLNANFIKLLSNEFTKTYYLNKIDMVTLDHSEEKNKLQIFFHQDYHVPLFVYYNGIGFKPSSKAKYYSKWDQVDDLNYSCTAYKGPKVKPEDIPPTLLEVLEQTASILGFSDAKPKVHQKTRTHVEQHKVFEPKRTEIPEKISLVPVIDLSKTGPLEYDSKRISVSSLKKCEYSDLFIYYRHSSTNSNPLTISSLILNHFPKDVTINFKYPMTFLSLDVYFHMDAPSKPLILVFDKINEKKYYTISVDGSKPPTISEDSSISSNFLNRLISESDKFNDGLTYQLEQLVDRGDSKKYGYNNRINIEVQKNIEKKGFTFITHTTAHRSNKVFVLSNGNVLTTRTEQQYSPINEIRDKKYEYIKVYFLDSNKKIPVLVEFNESSSKSTFYAYKRDEMGHFWTKESVDPSNIEKLSSKLGELYYYLHKSVIIELDKGGGIHSGQATNYDLRLIDNTLKYDSYEFLVTRYADGKSSVSETKINVLEPFYFSGTDKSTGVNGFMFVKHMIPKPSESENINIPEAAGLRLFIMKSTDKYPSELELYNKSGNSLEPGQRIHLYFSDSESIYKEVIVCFYGQDPRPLLVCYDQKAYQRIKIDDNIRWVYLRDVNYSDNNTLLSILNSIHSKMKRKLTFVKSGTEENISISTVETLGSFRRLRYTASTYHHNHGGPFILPIESVVKELVYNATISKLLEDFDNKTFFSVSVYYKTVRSDSFLFEFNDGSTNTHFQRVDKDARYWVNKEIIYKYDKELSEQLEKIKSNIDTTIVYEIDKTQGGYNKSITVESFYDFPETGFDKHIHSPIDSDPKRSLILYKNNELMGKDNDVVKPIKEIQYQVYRDVTVYFRAKSTDSILIVSLNKGGSTHDSVKHYSFKTYKSKSYWENVHIPFHDFLSKNLIRHLKQSELDLIQSIIILLDKKEGNTKYGEPEIKDAVVKLIPKADVNIQKMDSNCMNVHDRTDEDQGKCLKGTGYRVIEHRISQCANNQTRSGLRFFVPASTGRNNYSDITLFDTFNYKSTLYYNKPGGTEKVFVYFYGGVSDRKFQHYRDAGDPRPLLIYYGNVAFRPKKIGSPSMTKQVDVDFTSWIEVPDIRECVSKFSGKPMSNTTNEPLLNALFQVSGDLNPVQLNPDKILGLSSFITQSSTRPSTTSYNLHTFANSQTLLMQITSDNLNCYREYTYQPHFYTNSFSGYRLGNLIYTDISGNTHAINYSDSVFKYFSLMEVSVFYYLYDVNHRFPLLIILRFKDFNFDTYADCYQLTSRPGLKDKPGATFKWERITENGDDKDFLKSLRYYEDEISNIEKFINTMGDDGLVTLNDSTYELDKLTGQYKNHIEYKLYYIRDNLKIEFTDEEKKHYLFDPKNCSEGINTAAVVGGSVGGVVGTAAVTGGVTVAVRPELIITSIKALV